MSIRIPNQAVISLTDTTGTGNVNNQYTIPQDTTALTFKVYTTTSFGGSSPKADVYIQTTDDGGNSWYDCVHFTQITAAITAANAQWATVTVNGSSVTGLGSGYIGSVRASTFTASAASGLPLLSQLVRVTIVYSGTITAANGVTVIGYASSQDSHQ